MVGQQHRLQIHGQFPVVLLGIDQLPLALAQAGVAEAQHRMLLQVFRPARGPGAAQVTRRRNQQPLRDDDRSRDHIGVVEPSGAQDGQVKIFNRRHQRRIDRDVQHHLGVTPPEFGHQRGQDVHRHHGLGVYAQHAGQLIGLLAGRGLGLVHVVKDVPNPLQVGLPGFGQRQLARGALQQPRAQVLLKVRDQAGHHGR